MKFNFFGNTLKYASTCRRRRIAAVHHPGTHTSPPRWRFCHAARSRTRSARCVFLLAVGDRAAFPPTRRRQPHLHRGNGGGGPPDVSLEIFFDTAWEWLVAVVRRPVSPVPPPFTTPPPSVLSDAHRGLYPSFLRFSFGALRCFPPSIMCFSFRMFARLPLCSPVLAPPSPPPPHLLTPLPSSPFFFTSPVAWVTPACIPFFFCCCSRRRAVLRATSYVNRVNPSGTLALATPPSFKEPSSAAHQVGVGGDRPSPSAPPLPHQRWR